MAKAKAGNKPRAGANGRKDNEDNELGPQFLTDNYCKALQRNETRVLKSLVMHAKPGNALTPKNDCLGNHLAYMRVPFKELKTILGAEIEGFSQPRSEQGKLVANNSAHQKGRL